MIRAFWHSHRYLSQITSPKSSNNDTKVRPSITQLIYDSVPTRLQTHLDLIRFRAPTGTALALFPAISSLGIASYPYPVDLASIALFSAGAFFVRSAGCAVNDLLDKDFDSKVKRTSNRPLAAKKMTEQEARLNTAFCLSAASLTLPFLHPAAAGWAIATVPMVMLYPSFKRFTHFPQAFLGLTMNLGTLIACAHVTGYVAPWAWAFYFGSTTFTLFYDTIYAHQDKIDDALIGVKSTALYFGERTHDALKGFGMASILGWGAAGYLAYPNNWVFFATLAYCAARMYPMMNKLDLDDPEQCSQAFNDCSHILGMLALSTVIYSGISLFPEYNKADPDANGSGLL